MSKTPLTRETPESGHHTPKPSAKQWIVFNPGRDSFISNFLLNLLYFIINFKLYGFIYAFNSRVI